VVLLPGFEGKTVQGYVEKMVPGGMIDRSMDGCGGVGINNAGECI
jgi:hypothetical protein